MRDMVDPLIGMSLGIIIGSFFTGIVSSGIERNYYKTLITDDPAGVAAIRSMVLMRNIR